MKWPLASLFLATAVASTFALAQIPGLDLNPGSSARQGPVEVKASIEEAKEGRPAQLALTASIDSGWHVYSVTQPAGGPVKTTINLSDEAPVLLAGEFKPDRQPSRHKEPLFDNLTVEEHEGSVIWRAPVRLKAGHSAADAQIEGHVVLQACNEKGCLPPKKYPFSLTVASDSLSPGFDPAASQAASVRVPEPPQGFAIGPYQPKMAHLTISGAVAPRHAAAGSKVQVSLTFDIVDGYHVYPLGAQAPGQVGLPTEISFEPAHGLSFSQPETDAPMGGGLFGLGGDDYLEGKVTWTIEVSLPGSLAPGEYFVRGKAAYQTCNDRSCDPPGSVQFAAPVVVSSSPVEGEFPLFFERPGERAAPPLPGAAASSGTVGAPTGVAEMPLKQLPLTFEPIDRSVIVLTGQSRLGLLAAALLGGFLLNFMPCVLPVIGLKILAFVQQSGKDRWQSFLLNVWYSAGLISVFMVLALAAVVLRLKWGEQFTSVGFNIVLAGIVFAMSLSFLGIWEIPIPGFSGGGTAAGMASKEGATGAFSKGVITTILATPCSGPFLGSVFGLVLKQETWMIYSIFFCVGLGMAAPYLLIGAFPRMMRFLPKPGAWMETFKHVMGFVLLGTVVFLFSFIDEDYRLATFALLVGIWAACWWIGRTPLTAELGVKLRAWGAALAVVGVVAIASLRWLTPRPELIEWQPFTYDRLEMDLSHGRTVLIDFTADW
jgi:cytochrome c biogenesis protein CcdA/DsbC/DsbD-like thiol-disulfide interchange protein